MSNIELVSYFADRSQGKEKHVKIGSQWHDVYPRSDVRLLEE